MNIIIIIGSTEENIVLRIIIYSRPSNNIL